MISLTCHILLVKFSQLLEGFKLFLNKRRKVHQKLKIKDNLTNWKPHYLWNNCIRNVPKGSISTNTFQRPSSRTPISCYLSVREAHPKCALQNSDGLVCFLLQLLWRVLSIEAKTVFISGYKYVYFCKVGHFNMEVNRDWLAFGATTASLTKSCNNRSL